MDFRGFKTDNAHANWNVVRKIYNDGDLAFPLEGCEHTCLSIGPPIQINNTETYPTFIASSTQPTLHGIQGGQKYGGCGCQIPCDMSLVVVIRSNHRGWHAQLVGAALKLKTIMHTGDPKLFAKVVRFYLRAEESQYKDLCIGGVQNVWINQDKKWIYRPGLSVILIVQTR